MARPHDSVCLQMVGEVTPALYRRTVRIREAATDARRRVYAAIYGTERGDPAVDSLWQRHGAIFDWEDRMLARFVARAA